MGPASGGTLLSMRGQETRARVSTGKESVCILKSSKGGVNSGYLAEIDN